MWMGFNFPFLLHIISEIILNREYEGITQPVLMIFFKMSLKDRFHTKVEFDFK